MISRIKKIGAWVILLIMVFCMAVGCSVASAQDGGAIESTVQAGMQETGAAEKTGAVEKAGTTEKTSTAEKAGTAPETSIADSADLGVDEHGSYSTKDEVALYLHTFGHLPDNYITKKEAQKLGWDSKKGNLPEVAPGKSIGGSHFGNYEGQLPEKEDRKYFECDLEYDGGYRGAKRLIYSDDGLIFYTEDHYKTFEQLY